MTFGPLFILLVQYMEPGMAAVVAAWLAFRAQLGF